MALGVVGMGRNSRMFAGMRRFENFFLLKKNGLLFLKVSHGGLHVGRSALEALFRYE